MRIPALGEKLLIFVECGIEKVRAVFPLFKDPT